MTKRKTIKKSGRKKVIIKKSTNSKKKYMAVFYEGDKKIKTIAIRQERIGRIPCQLVL
jgi:hypothetical protein